ncbi:hypothetical protein C0Q70_06759 [Pomacea canaliculata]|uniref:Uncharacterized protein n=1 Tax=Pomacea canaliculata TaxID=400727 RepID=A0A2T7PD63_POMCA|nr:uncharacterized protein LOC112563334 isoform X2 [Pomacea canaliculata]PVD31347.1 hypothetical protein C0Q70_06759 [Pomacea canaliculata]
MAAKRKADDVNLKGSSRNCTEPFRLPSIVIDGRHNCQQPLFLGTDVLAGIKQDTKNHTRIHARFATQGLATKLVFTDVRIEGINNSGTVWFYSIQGMFQAVFEYHAVSVQRHCLQHLTDVWLKTSSGDLLAEMYNISPTNLILSMGLDCPLGSRTPLCGLSQMKSENKHYSEMPEREEVLGKSGKRMCDLISLWIEDASRLREGISTNEEKMDYQKEIPKTSGLRKSKVDKTKEDTNEGRFSEGSVTDEIKKISFTTLVLDFLHNALKILQIPKDMSFMSQLMQLLTSALDNSLASDHASGDSFGLGPVHTAVLTSISKWLGDEFHHLEAAISSKVTSFKQRNINSIDNLPPAEQVVNEIFPSCMIQLVSTWIGLTELQSADSLQMDHNYGHKRSMGERPTGLNRNLYPVIQHILELTNNSLVSGVAHVVYCQLRHAS